MFNVVVFNYYQHDKAGLCSKNFFKILLRSFKVFHFRENQIKSFNVLKFSAVQTFLLNCRLKIFSEESVPLFGPPLPSPPVFTDHQEFRDFLLVKRKGEKNYKSCKCAVLAWMPLPAHIAFLDSNQWRESHAGDTDVCPEATADAGHVDPLALPRPHA